MKLSSPHVEESGFDFRMIKDPNASIESSGLVLALAMAQKQVATYSGNSEVLELLRLYRP